MPELLSTGIPGLDHIFGGGIPYGYSCLIEGENGIGKTSLALQYVRAIASYPDERALYVTFVELPEELHRFARNFGWDLKQLEAEGRLQLLAISPELFLRELLSGSGAVRDMLETFMPTRLVIDAVTDLRLYLDSPHAFRAMLEALLNLFRRRKITTLLIQDTGPDNAPSGLIRRVADINVLMQWQPVGDGSLMDRVLNVTKVRGRDHYNSYVLFEIDQHGVIVIPPDYETFPREPVQSITVIPPSGLSGGFSTGFPRLDHLIGGGMPFQSTWLYTVDENSYYPDLYLPLISQAIADGATLFLLRSGRHTFEEASHILSPYGFSFERLAQEQRIVIGELFDQPVPAELQSAIVAAHRHQRAESFADAAISRVQAMLARHPGGHHLMILFTDALVRRFGSQGLPRVVERLIGGLGHHAVAHVLVSNVHELRPTDQAYLGFTARGIVQFWKNGGYQYLQVAKTPRNSSSPPCILIRQATYPYLRLLVRR